MDYEIARAFKNGDYKRASELLQKVSDFNNQELLWLYPRNYTHINNNTYNVTLLHLAAYHGWLDICKQLITEYKYNPHVQYSFGSLTDLSTQTYFYSYLPPPPPLFYATLSGHYEVVKYLINKCNCDPHQQSVEGETPLYLACLARHYEIVTHLINESHCDPNTGGSYNPLHGACKGGNLQIVNYLTSLSSVDVNIKDKNGCTPLHTACRYGIFNIIKFLVSLPSVDVNIRDICSYTPLHIACLHDQLDITKFLVSLPSVDVNIRDISSYTPLHTACRSGHLDIIKFLVSLPSIDVNIRDDGGYTTLHTACHYGHTDIIKFLVSLPSIDVNIRDDGGYTPLHTACCYGHLEIIKFLVSLPLVDVDIRDDGGYTPLHTACRYGHLEIIKFLVSLPLVDVDIRDNSSYIPLHTACHYGHLDIIKFLVSLDVNIRDDGGYTPLHTACRYGHLEIIKFLVFLPLVDGNIQDNSSYTPLHTACRYGHLEIIKFLVFLPSVDVNIRDNSSYTPLHTACRHGHLGTIQFLVSLSSVDVNIQDDSGYTPLHTAYRYGHLDIIKFLVSSSTIDVNIKNKDGYILLHTACHYGQLDIIKSLVSSSSVDVNIQDDSGYTPLHTACRYGQLHIIQFLLSLSSVDVNIRIPSYPLLLHKACRNGTINVVKFLLSASSIDVNSKDNGYILLHTACRYGHVDTIKFLVSLPSIDVNIPDDGGYTPLHIACKYCDLDIVHLLMSTEQINPISTNKNGDTPLHIACSYSIVDIVKYLLLTGRIDPMAKNRYQETPVQLAGNNYGILKLFDPFEQCRVDFPVESYSKVFLCGNTTNGKSSLVNALEKRVKGVLQLEWLNPFKQQKKAEALTAGIVPHHLQNNEIGNIVLYDFAGHPEYYSSHEAVLENLMLRSPAVFIILIKLTDKLEDIEKQLYYWTGFVENIGYRMSKKSQVIVVGSHADKRRADNVINLIKRIDIERIIEHHEYKGFVAVDCRNKNGVGFDEFVTCLSESTKAVVNTSDSISFYCHVLYAFLKTKLDQVAITLGNLLQMMQIENEPSLPSNESVLFEFLTILSDKGLILFIRSTDCINSWVIINKSSLLKDINGTLFAPSHFKEYCSTLASNTGIVPVSVLRDVFPQYDPDMLVGFLKSLEFCHEIDENTLKIITTNLSSSSEKLLYFPALVSVEPSSEVTITDGFGWGLWCPNSYQFFSTRFLQVLLLRIAYELSLQLSDVGIIHVSPVQTLDRSCHVWKNGICWTRDGVKTVVQVSEQNRSVVVLVQLLDESIELEVLQVSSSVIQKILQINKEFCHSCDTRECLISPHHLNIALQYNLKDLSVFKIEDIARVLILKRMFVTSNMTESLNISSLLGQLEPYHSLPLSVIHQLFDHSKVNDLIPEHVFREIQERCRPIMDIYPVTRESSTYQSVRDHLKRFSVFGGRNPFVSE